VSPQGDSDVLTEAIPAVAPVPRRSKPGASAAGSTGEPPSGSVADPVRGAAARGRPADSGIGSFPSQAELVAPTAPTRIVVLLVVVAVGILVSVGLGVYGRLHQPTFTGLSVAGFSSGTAAKSWLGSAAFALVLVQLLSAFGMYRTRVRWLSGVHRWSGRVAVLLTVPVAVHCLYALGFQLGSPRVLVHSLAGCFAYGVFAAKMLVLPRTDAPRWSIPVLGGVLFSALTAVWLTSSLWFFSTSGMAF
jgi:Family of unknown function (DUF6529)